MRGRDTHQSRTPVRCVPDTVDPRRAAIGELAARQFGLLTRRQAREAGMSRSSIDRRVNTGEWIRTDQGVYRVAGSPVTWHQRLLAACLAGPAVASHRSAAELWGFPVDGFPEIVEVTAIRHRRRHAAGVVWHESQRLDPRYVATVDDVPVTTPIRTIVDLAVVLDTDDVEKALYSAMRLRLASIEGVERALEDLGALRLGRKRAREVIKRARAHDRPPDTVLETDFLQLLRNAGLPLPEPQREIRDEEGIVVGRADFFYPSERLVIELDSSQWHSIGIDIESDEDRDRRMMDLDYRIIRVSRRLLRDEPQKLVNRMRKELG
jgi:very-short-patch-repair endonuclease